MSTEREELRAATENAIARAYGVPVEILRMSDAQFHHWLHHTDEGRRILEADREGEAGAAGDAVFERIVRGEQDDDSPPVS